MWNLDDSEGLFAAHRPTPDRSRPDREEAGTLHVVLERAEEVQPDIDPVSTRKEEELVELADDDVGLRRTLQVEGNVERTRFDRRELGDKIAERVIDAERAIEAGNPPAHAECEPERLPGCDLTEGASRCVDPDRSQADSALSGAVNPLFERLRGRGLQ